MAMRTVALFCRNMAQGLHRCIQTNGAADVLSRCRVLSSIVVHDALDSNIVGVRDRSKPPGRPTCGSLASVLVVVFSASKYIPHCTHTHTGFLGLLVFEIFEWYRALASIACYVFLVTLGHGR